MAEIWYLFMRTQFIALIFLLLYVSSFNGHARDSERNPTQAVDKIIQPLMVEYGIPGMAVGIVAGNESYVFTYGVASTETGKPVTHNTLFELGSISKTLTATLAAYAQAEGYLSLSDHTSKHLPFLQGSVFGDVSLIHLGTHTAGELPLQVPEDIRNTDQLMLYLRGWQSAYVPGICRIYANPGIGILGLIAAKSMSKDFVPLMEQNLFPALGMRHSFIHVPQSRMIDYALGRTKANTPIRMQEGILSSEAYGIKSTVADMLRFLQINLGLIELDAAFQQAVMDTHTGYFKAGVMTQALMWEYYPYPVTLETLLKGNAPGMTFNPVPVTAITPPQKPDGNIWVNKTGSTNGFGAYIAFIPGKQMGIVLLANKNFPIAERITAAYQILSVFITSD